MKELIVGAGNMIQALLPEYIKSSDNDFYVFTPSKIRAEQFAVDNKINYLPEIDNGEYDLIWLGMKPQQLEQAVELLTPLVSENTIIVSLLAAIETKTLSESFKTDNIIRIMPNTPALVGRGVNGIFYTGSFCENYWQVFYSNFKNTGRCFVFDREKLIDTITPYSGSGPAYFFEICRILADKLTSEGLEEQDAKELVALTMQGASEMILKSSDSIKKLRDNVTSKGGITFEALKVLSDSKLEIILNKAINHAHKRGNELKKK